MIKKKTCNLCQQEFKPGLPNRLQIVKKLERGNVEIWICPRCTPRVKDSLKDLHLLR